jgi:hypothetical protein
MIKVREIVDSINTKSLEDAINKFNLKQTENYKKILNIEEDLEKYKLDQDKKYRDVVRKVLDLDNS